MTVPAGATEVSGVEGASVGDGDVDGDSGVVSDDGALVAGSVVAAPSSSEPQPARRTTVRTAAETGARTRDAAAGTRGVLVIGSSFERG